MSPFDFESIIDTATVDGRTTTTTYDKEERTDTTVSPMGRTATVEYDEDDRPVRLTSAGREDVEIHYDARGRVSSVTQGDAENSVTYGADGRVATSTDAEGGTTGTVRDAVGQPTAVTGPDGETTGFDYDDAGNLTQLTAPDGRAFTFTYDDNGNVTAMSEPARAGSGQATQQSSIEYDAADRPTKTTRPSGKELELTYDSAGRVQHTEADDGTSVQSEFQTTGARNLKALETDAGVRTGLSFDGPLLTSISTRGDGDDPAQESQVSLTYDNSGRPASETIDGDTQSFAYNNDDQPTQIGPLQIGYDLASGDATSITAGTTVSRFATSDRGLVDGLSAAVQGSSGETPVFTEQVVRDKLGRITQRTTTIGIGSPSVSAYSYDDAGRLVEVKTNGLTTETYGYNNTGGLTSRGNGVLSNWIATDGYGRPTSAADGTTATWSTDGELTSLSAPGQTASTLTYDGFGRIKTISPQGGATGTYEYDGMGRRVALRVGGQIQRRYLYGGGQFPRARLDADGDVLERYVYGAQSHVPELIVRRDGQRLRLITDLTGSVRVVLDADTGAVVQQLAYDAYGRTTLDTNPGTQPFGFKGALADPTAQGAGLVWMGSRAYLPSLARFSTAEPEGVSVAWNQHDALGSEPVNLADVTGFAPSAGTVANTSAGVGDALLGVFCFGFCNPGAALRRAADR